MTYEITFPKLENVAFRAVSAINTTPMAVVDFIDGGEDGWENPDQHQEWLNTASDEEIAAWVIAGLQ